ncbi:MAG: hypothetical protein ABIH34_07450 [Nanoarchaeota archaeon]
MNKVETLADIVQGLRDPVFRGKFDKHTALIETDQGRVYLYALLNPHWQKHVSAEIGQDLYKRLLDFLDLKEEGRDQERQYLHETGNPDRRHFNLPPLAIDRSAPFDPRKFFNALKTSEEISALLMEAETIIYEEFFRQAERDETLFVRAYKDELESGYKKDDQGLNDDYQRRLSQKIGFLKESVDDNYPRSFVVGNLQSLSEQMPLMDIDTSIFELQEEYTDDREKNALRHIIEAAESVLDNRELLQKHSAAYQNHVLDTFHERAVKVANDRHVTIELDSQFPLDLELEVNWNAYFSGDRKPPKYDQSEVLDAPLPLREKIVDSIEARFMKYRTQLIGLTHILSGAEQSHPQSDPYSTLHNEARYPNIPYSQEAIKELRTLSEKIRRIFTFPDLCDMAVPSDIMEQQELRYVMIEEPKDPLDLDFEYDAEFDQNRHLPAILTDDEITLFGIYRLDDSGIERIGFVEGYGTRLESNGFKILSANSLELNRFRVPGGTEIHETLVNYVEDWLTAYAQKMKYEGVSMGNQDENIATAYSMYMPDVIKESLIFNGMFSKHVKSHIFSGSDGEAAIAFPNSSYWIWKPKSL